MDHPFPGSQSRILWSFVLFFLRKPLIRVLSLKGLVCVGRVGCARHATDAGSCQDWCRKRFGRPPETVVPPERGWNGGSCDRTPILGCKTTCFAASSPAYTTVCTKNGVKTASTLFSLNNRNLLGFSPSFSHESFLVSALLWTVLSSRIYLCFRGITGAGPMTSKDRKERREGAWRLGSTVKTARQSALEISKDRLRRRSVGKGHVAESDAPLQWLLRDVAASGDLVR